jgi:hypothetical protein
MGRADLAVDVQEWQRHRQIAQREYRRSPESASAFMAVVPLTGLSTPESMV